MRPENLERLVYTVSPSDKIAFSSKRISINFVPHGECTNRCVFCAPNIPAMEKVVDHEVLLNEDYTVDEMVEAASKSYEQNPDCSEIIITGTIGEPLLYFDRLLEFIPRIKCKTSLPVRLNTNGQANLILPEYSSQEVCQILEAAGLDSVVVSLNATNEKDYVRLCNPKQPGAFDSVLDFVKASTKSKIDTYVSFVEYSKTHPDFPSLDRNQIKEFCETLGIPEDRIVYRPIIE